MSGRSRSAKNGAGGSAHRETPAVVAAETKVHVPDRRPDVVRRERLVALLVAGAAHSKLTLVDAPPGWGKTTVLAEWHRAEQEHRRFAWLSLDHGDNDPVRFFQCLIDALRTVHPGIGAQALAALGTADLVDAVLPLLVNEIEHSLPDTVLVLDDYHLIVEPTVHTGVEFLLDRLPRALHLAIATRSDPPLPLGRMRVRREIVELRAAQLRFTEDEAAALLAGALGAQLGPEEVSSLCGRTEGWAAGLQLAGLSLRGHQDARAFISSFAGDDRQIVDYLGFEVLDGQSEDVRDFLLDTSLLERLSGPLCDAVTGVEGANAMLEMLDRANLFVVPLDSNRRWYRYHQLFRELLQHELHRTKPGRAAVLHQRACEWHSEQGSIPEAIHHAIAAHDISRASELVTAHWYDYLQQGRLQTVAGWLDELGEALVHDDPNLCLVRAWVGVNTGRLDEVDRWIVVAEQARDRQAARGRSKVLDSGVASLRAIHRYMSGDVSQAVTAGRHSLEMAPGRTPWRPVGCPVLGISLFWSGSSTEAEVELRAAVQLAESDGNHLAKVHALGGLAAISAEHGDYDEAARLAASSAQIAEDHSLSEHWATTLARVVGGEALERSGRMAEAAELVDRGVALSGRGVATLEQAYALLLEAELRHARGDADAAMVLSAARRAITACADPGILEDMLGRTERRLRRESGGVELKGTEAQLSGRELAVLRLLPSGLSQRELGDALFVSLNTVKTHLKSIYRKLDAGTREEAVDRARELQLI